MNFQRLSIAAMAVSVIAVGCAQQQNPKPVSQATPNAPDMPTPPPSPPNTPDINPNPPPAPQSPTSPVPPR